MLLRLLAKRIFFSIKRQLYCIDWVVGDRFGRAKNETEKQIGCEMDRKEREGWKSGRGADWSMGGQNVDTSH